MNIYATVPVIKSVPISWELPVSIWTYKFGGAFVIWLEKTIYDFLIYFCIIYLVLLMKIFPIQLLFLNFAFVTFSQETNIAIRKKAIFLKSRNIQLHIVNCL